MSIHTFGDSHASNTISGWKNCKNIVSHHLGAILAYSIGRDKLERLDISKFDLKDGDTVVFCFGEIDCRCHIYKYITESNTYQSIINNIVDNYIEAIKINIKNCNIKLKNVCIYNVVPPVKKSNTKENKKYPYLGTDEERKSFSQYFNICLKEKCIENNFIFFDIYNKYCDEEGFLNKKLSDGNVHIKNGMYIQEFINENLI